LAPEPDNTELEGRLKELEEIEEEERQRLVKEALGKFNVFLHMTAWAAGCAYLVLLGVFVPKALPFVLIAVGLWTAGLAYHTWRAWHREPATSGRSAKRSRSSAKRRRAIRRPPAKGQRERDRQ
jgi:hypothetical protein